MVVKTKLSFFLFFIFFGLSRWLRNRWFSGNDSCLEITVPVLWFICMSWSFPLQSHPSWYHCGWDQDKSKGGNISRLVSSHIGLPRGEVSPHPAATWWGVIEFAHRDKAVQCVVCDMSLSSTEKSEGSEDDLLQDDQVFMTVFLNKSYSLSQVLIIRFQSISYIIWMMHHGTNL